MRARRVSVVGLGLIGGSLARTLAARGVHVIGYDRERSFLDAAVAEGMVHDALDDTLAGVERADVVILATPVAATGVASTTTSARSTPASVSSSASCTIPSATAASRKLRSRS